MMSTALSYNTNPLLPNRALSDVDHPTYIAIYSVMMEHCMALTVSLLALLIIAMCHYTITMYLVHL